VFAVPKSMAISPDTQLSGLARELNKPMNSSNYIFMLGLMTPKLI